MPIDRVAGGHTALPMVGTVTDRSGTIAAGSVSEELMAANADRRYLLIQNVDAANDLFVRFGAAAATLDQPSFKLGPGVSLVMEDGFVSREAIQIISASVSHPFTAVEA